MKNIAINIKKGKGQRKKAVKALRLNGYKVISLKDDNIKAGRINYLSWEELKDRYEYFQMKDMGELNLHLKKQGGGDWSKLYELIEKDKGSVVRLPEHDTFTGFNTITDLFGYPQYGKDVDPDKIDAYFDGEDTLKVVTDFLDKVEITGLPELGKIDGDLVTGRPQQSWDYPCYGRGKSSGAILLFESERCGRVVIPSKIWEVNHYSSTWDMSYFTPTNIKEV